MTTTEMVLNMLAETATTDISKAEKPKNFSENRRVAKQGGEVAGIAREALEKRTGAAAISPGNAVQLNRAVIDMIESVAKIADKAPEPAERE